MDVTIKCICPPKADGEPRHEQDTITLKDRFSFHEVVALQKDMQMAGSDDEATVGDSLAALTEGYIVRGITSWTLVDEKGRALAVNRTTITDRLFSLNPTVAMDISAAAEELYNPSVLLPLVTRVSKQSDTGQTEPSTSAPTDSPRKPRKPSKPSLTSTTPTDGTETITSSPAGGSRSSQNGTSEPLPV
jgi:hypothetical protein